MPNQNAGSFGAATGGSKELLAAMQRRGIDASALQQVSPGSAGGTAPVPPNVEMQAASSALPQPEQAPQQPQEDSELKIALKALGGFVTSEGKMRRDLATGRQQGMI